MDNIPLNQYVPDTVSPPGETLKETLDALGMSQADLAERTGRPRKTINEIIKGKTAITSETALQLERVLGAPASFWNNRERNYRDALARLAEQDRLEAEAEWLKTIPVSAMVKAGWVRRFNNKVQQLREVLNFFGVASPEQWKSMCAKLQANFRHSAALKSDLGAMVAWLRKGELDAQAVACAPYDDIGFHQVLTRVRELTLQPPGIFVAELQEQCRQAGVAVVFVPLIRKVYPSGVARWLSPQKALIQLSLRYKTDDHVWFSFFHEAGHILYGGRRAIFIDGDRVENEREEKANAFAEDVLIPRPELVQFISRGRRSKVAIRTFARHIGVAPGIVVGRLQHEGYLPRTHCNDLKRRLTWVSK